MGMRSIDLLFKTIFPFSIDCSPIHIENKVVFPQPLGPKTPTHSPGKTYIEIFFKIGLPEKDLLKSFISKIGLSFLNFKILKPFFINFYICVYIVILKWTDIQLLHF